MCFSSGDLGALIVPVLQCYFYFSDRDAVQTLEKKIKAERQTCGERALYLAAMYLWLSGRHDKAREYVERALKMSTYNIEVCPLVVNNPCVFKNLNVGINSPWVD